MTPYTLLCLVCLVVVALQTVAGVCNDNDDGYKYDPIEYTVRVIKWRERRYRCYPCWCRWRWCKWRWCTFNRPYYTIVKKWDYSHCCDGWKGQFCNIPICSPECPTNYVCFGKNKCYCNDQSSGAVCDVDDIKGCSYELNCYPGSCRSSTCLCASGFEGNNCNKMRDSPSFRKCQLRLLVKSDRDEKVVFTGLCDSPEPYYSNRSDVTHIVLDWETGYNWPTDIPHRPRYIGNVTLGVIATAGSVSLLKADGHIINTEPVQCTSPVSPSNPHLVSECPNVRRQLKSVKHRYQLAVNMTATTGGFKEVLNTNSQTLYHQIIKGESSWQSVSVTFDLQAPTHCTETDSCSNDYVLPVDVGSQIDNDPTPKQNILYFGWNDTDSGLNTFLYEVFQLIPDSNELLTEESVPVAQGNQTISSEEFPSYTLSRPGMYSVILTVKDAAGNAALARGLFLWDAQSNVTVTNQPMSVKSATDVREKVVWLTSPVNSVVVNWQGHFENTFQHDNKLLNKVKPWPASKGLDDRQGNRTVEAIPNRRGIVNFYVGYDHGTQVTASSPRTWTDVGLEETVKLQKPISNGDFLKVFVKAEDVTGNSATNSLVVALDSSPPEFHKKEIERNVDSGDPKLPYSSRIALYVEDKESGIKEIHYVVSDVTLGTQVGNGTIKGQMDGERRTKRATDRCQDGTCVCTPLNGCYRRSQEFYLNHCWLVRGIGHDFKVDATIYNNAGLATPKNFNLDNVVGLSGVNVYSKPTSLTVKKSHGATVEISWSYDVSCYVIVGASVTVKTSSAPPREWILLAHQTSYVVDDLKDDGEYTVKIVTRYEDGIKSEATTLRFNSGEFMPVPNMRHTDSNKGALSSPGAIAGLVIVILLLLVIIAILALFVVTRLRKKEPILPRNLQDFRRTMRQSIYFGGDESITRNRNASTVHFRDNLTLYNEEQGNDYGDHGNSDDLYDYSNQAADTADSWKVASERLVLGQRLPGANGRFAHIHEATLAPQHTVVAKKLKDPNNADDKALMVAKMKFWVDSKLKHENILHFVGAVPEGPILLFELCNLGRLKNWLAAQRKVTEDVEDKMITFSVHIARGMQYLHSQQILHRRLGTRNILLTRAGNDTIVAKISGFGPMKGDLEDSEVDPMDEKVPVKWMAPEQLDLPPDVTRPYDTKTDIWSFGVTMWEMFSKGDIPYDGITSGGLKARLDSGYRMERPEHCPELMYEQVVQPCWNGSATARPTFDDVSKKIEGLFIGGATDDDEYYYDRRTDEGYKNIWE